MAKTYLGARKLRIVMAASAAAAAMVAPFALTSNTFAADLTWNNATPPGNWNNTASWLPAQLPVAADAISFGAIGAATAAATVTNVVNQNFTVAAINYSQQSDAGTPQFHNT